MVFLCFTFAREFGGRATGGAKSGNIKWGAAVYKDEISKLFEILTEALKLKEKIQ
jgi:hypothetical protein